MKDAWRAVAIAVTLMGLLPALTGDRPPSPMQPTKEPPPALLRPAEPTEAESFGDIHWYVPPTALSEASFPTPTSRMPAF